MIINIRGTNGSGKSYIVEQVLKGGARPIFGELGTRHPEAYHLGVPWNDWFVLGPYDRKVWNGADCFKPYDRLLLILDRYSSRGHILFESLLASGNIGRLGEFLTKHEGIAAFMSTPIDQCIERVRSRTRDSFDPTKKLEPKFREVRRCRERMLEAGTPRVVDLSADDPVADVLALMREGGPTR